MKQKTAIQELKEYFEQQLRLQRSSKIKYTTEESLVDTIQVCQNAINTKEKEQIKDAFVAGSERGTNDTPFNCEQYYTQNFNNNN